jgi:hypothetical protein
VPAIPTTFRQNDLYLRVEAVSGEVNDVVVTGWRDANGTKMRFPDRGQEFSTADDGTVATIGSTCISPPLSEAVADAVLITHGRVTRVDYLDREGASEPVQKRTTDNLCGQKLVTFENKSLLKGEAGHDVTGYSDDGCVGLGG